MGYSIDTSGLITSWQITHNPKNHPSFWDKLDVLISKHELRASKKFLKTYQKKMTKYTNGLKVDRICSCHSMRIYGSL